MVEWRQTSKMSWQEWWLMRALGSGPAALTDLRLMLPESDRRTRAVQSASLSRSLTRLAKRGLITSVNRKYVRADSTAAR